MTLQSEILSTIGWITGISPDEFETSNTLESLAFDSIDRTELAVRLEEEHDVKIPDGAESEWQTVADVISTIEALKGV